MPTILLSDGQYHDADDTEAEHTTEYARAEIKHASPGYFAMIGCMNSGGDLAKLFGYFETLQDPRDWGIAIYDPD